MIKNYRYIFLGALVFFGFYICSLYNYLLFHSLSEIFSIAIAFVIFTIVWNSRHFLKNNYFIFIGIAFLFIGCIDLLHTLSYKGLNIFAGYGANLPTQLWIGARYMQSISLLLAPLFFQRNLKLRYLLNGYLISFLLLIMSIFYWEIFPVCYIEEIGLTPFKKISEYIISLILLSSIIPLLANRDRFDGVVLRWIIWSIIFTIFSEVIFTTYTDVYGNSILVGHYFKIASFWCLYKALVETGLKKPYGLLLRELKQSEERYRSLITYMINGVAYHKVIYDGEGNPIDYIFLDVNDAFEKVMGLEKKDLIGKRVKEVLPGIEKDPVNWISIFGRVAMTGESVHFEEYLTSLNRWYYVSAYSVERGYFFTILRDVTESRNAQDTLKKAKEDLESRVNERTLELSQANELLQTIINHMPAMLFICDSKGNVNFINRVFENVTGWTLNDAGGTDCIRSCHPDPDIYEEMWYYIREAQPGWRDFLLKTRDGRDLEISWASVRLSDGSIIGIGIDITDRKKMEKMLAENIIKLELSNRELQEFAFAASHDLQEPLRKIRTFGDMLISKYGSNLGETGADYINRMQKASSRMQRLIDSLLSYSKVSTKAKPFSLVDLNKTVKDALANLEIRISESNATIEVGELPSIEADDLQMIQLFQNLIGNALKFGKKDNLPRVKIYAKAVHEDRLNKLLKFEISVEDNGIGFDEKYIERIFFPFQRLHRRDEYEGEGIGLAICNKIVQRHKGSISVKSTPNSGSIFIVTLPEKQV